MATEKLAFVVDEGDRLTGRFGHAPLAVVITLAEGREIAREVRAKPHEAGDHGHHHHGRHDHNHGDHEHGHDHDHHDHDHDHKHGEHRPDPAPKFEALRDCDAVIVRSMGRPAYAYARQHGIRVLLVGEKTVDEALAAYVAGTLAHDERRLH